MKEILEEKLKLQKFQKFDKIMIIWAFICLIFWMLFIIFIQVIFQMLYFLVWVFFFGTFVWINKDFFQEKLRSWNIKPFLKFMILGLSMILLEETFAALFNHLSEGFNTSLFLLRIIQFWMFNLIAFTPWYIGWYLLIKKFHYTTREVFYLAGISGLIIEGIIWYLFTFPLGFLFWAPLLVFTYGIIIFLPYSSLNEENCSNKHLNKYIKYIISVIIPILFLVFIGGLIISILWPIFPELFPPAKFGFSYQG